MTDTENVLKIKNASRNISAKLFVLAFFSQKPWLWLWLWSSED
jgi:hypothetical protein